MSDFSQPDCQIGLDIETRSRQVLELALKAPLSAEADIRREDTAAWDSLKHVELIFLIEDEFGIVLSEDQMAEIRSLADIVTLVRNAR